MAKKRHVVVIDDQVTFQLDSTVEVVVVTTTTDDPEGTYVLLPWHPSGNVCTKLKEESYAAAHWVERVPVEELNTNIPGYVRLSDLRKILDAVGRRERL